MENVDIECLAMAWASIDGKLEIFKSCKKYSSLDEIYGYYEGYIAVATELVNQYNSYVKEKGRLVRP